jgi:hypothetical protein
MVAGTASGKLAGKDEATEAAEEFVFDELVFDEFVLDGAALPSSDICGAEGMHRAIPFCEFPAALGVDSRPLVEDSGKAASSAAEVGTGAGTGER